MAGQDILTRALVRRPDWPERLAFAIAEHRKGAFEWGQYDCGTLFSDCVYAMTDADPLEPFGQWRSKFTGLRCLAKTGCRSVQEAVAERFEEVPVLQARRGDVGFVAGSGPLTCPVIITGADAISRNEAGWISVPIDLLTVAYRVG